MISVIWLDLIRFWFSISAVEAVVAAVVVVVVVVEEKALEEGELLLLGVVTVVVVEDVVAFVGVFKDDQLRLLLVLTIGVGTLLLG